MNTLTDLKRLLDEGETICHGEEMIWRWDPTHYIHSPIGEKYTWYELIGEVITDPSLWHQRDQIGAEKPVMMAVPVEQWDALQEELTELRRFKKRIETDPYLMLQRNMTEEQRQRANQGINQKQNK